MKNFTKALYTKAGSSAFMTSIGNRLFENEAPDGAAFPYCVYQIVSDVKEWEFTERFRDILVQFSIFSTASGSTEIKDIYTNLIALYDECSFSITSNTLVWMWRNNLTTMRDEVTTPIGTLGVWHYSVDFDAYIEVG